MPKTISPIKPWLIQRCMLGTSGEFIYDFMGSAHFECGGQAKALKTLIRGKVSTAETSVFVNNGIPVPVYIIMQKEFDIHAYQPYLEEMAKEYDGTLGLEEMSNFSRHLAWKATGQKPGWGADYDIWLDFTESDGQQNSVLWTLDEKKRDALLARLKVVTNTWAANCKAD
jgi:hypothetical protein